MLKTGFSDTYEISEISIILLPASNLTNLMTRTSSVDLSFYFRTFQCLISCGSHSGDSSLHNTSWDNNPDMLYV